MRVLFITNIPSPYRVNFFNALGEKCDLTVLFEMSNSKERDKSWTNFSFKNFIGIILNGKAISTDMSISFKVLKYLNNKVYDFIIISNFVSPTGIIAIEYMKLRRIKYIIESDGGFAKDGKGFKEHIKKHVLKDAYKYFSTSDELDKYYMKYGANISDIIRYPFTSLYDKDISVKLIKQEEKSILKRRLNIKEKRIIISVGQMIYRKGFDILLETIPNIDNDVGVYIIGGNPTSEIKKIISENNISNVHFIPFLSKDKLNEYYLASDLFVLSTRNDIWGLVINEAMAHGLPIITTNKCIAGLELVVDGYNGYIVPVNDIVQLSDRINEIINDEILREYMGSNSLNIIKDYTIEKMVIKHLEVLKC